VCALVTGPVTKRRDCADASAHENFVFTLLRIALVPPNITVLFAAVASKSEP